MKILIIKLRSVGDVLLVTPLPLIIGAPWDNNAMESLHDRKKGFQEIGKHRIYTEKRDCLPCSKNGCNNSLISDCLMDLDIGFIANQIKDMASENLNS
jgi:heptosyltransferase-3